MRNSSFPAGFDLWETLDGIRENFAPRVAQHLGHGDIRSAILLALAEEPMHGYQIIQAIETRTHGAWKPTPGSVYPTLQLLADEGLATSEQVGERKVYTLTETGVAAAAELKDETTSGESRRPWGSDRNGALPKAGAKLAQATAQVATSGSAEQTEKAVAVIDEARRKIYAILAED